MGAPARTTASGTWPTSSRARCRARGSSTRRAAGRTRGATASTSTKVDAWACRPSRRGGRCEAGSTSSSDAFRSARLAAADLEDPRYRRVRQVRQLLGDGTVDARLRRPVAGGRRPVSAGNAGACRRLPLLRRAARAHLRRPRHVAALRELSSTRRPARRRWSPSIRCAPTSATGASSSSSRSTCSPRSIFTRVRVLLLVLGQLARARRAPTPTRIVERFGLGAASLVVEVASNDGYLLQHFVARGIPVLGHRAGRERRRGGASARASRRWSRSSARRRRATLAAEGRRADLLIGNNVLAQVPDLNDFVAGMALAAGAGRRRHARVPAPAAAHGGEPVRHDLPRALLVLLVPDRRAASSPRTACAVFDVEELPTHGGSLRIYARHADDARAARSARASTRLRAARAGGRPRAPRDATRAFGERVHEAKRELLEFLIGARRRGKTVVGYGAPGQGQHAAQLLRHPDRLPRLHGRPQPVQAGQVPARHAHPDLRSRADRRDAAGLRAHPALEPEGRDHGADGAASALGRAVRGPDPGDRSPRVSGRGWPWSRRMRVAGDRASAPRCTRWCRELYPICRSLTGDGVRETLAPLGRELPLDAVTRCRRGTQVFDWTVPREWNIRDAWVKDAAGDARRRLPALEPPRRGLQRPGAGASDARRAARPPPLAARAPRLDSVPHVLLRGGLGLLPEPTRQLGALPDGEYEVCIDATLEAGQPHLRRVRRSPGETDDEVLFSCHVCHPSLVQRQPLRDRRSPRSLGRAARDAPRAATPTASSSSPGTIGSITWLARNEARVAGSGTGSCSRASATRAAHLQAEPARRRRDRPGGRARARRRAARPTRSLDFSPVRLRRAAVLLAGLRPPRRLPDAHAARRIPGVPHAPPTTSTSSRPDASRTRSTLPRRSSSCSRGTRAIVNRNPKCEPQLGRRGLYRAVGRRAAEADEMAMLWVLNLSDGAHSLLDIAERSGLPFDAVGPGRRRPRGARAPPRSACRPLTSRASRGAPEVSGPSSPPGSGR